jgi:hypothetical protein
MQDDNRLMRTVRVRNDQTLGTLGRLLMAIAEAGGDVRELRLIEQTRRFMIRDITFTVPEDSYQTRKSGCRTDWPRSSR